MPIFMIPILPAMKIYKGNQGYKLSRRKSPVFEAQTGATQLLVNTKNPEPKNRRVTHSFFLHAVPDSPLTWGPFRSIIQRFVIQEPSPCA
jgi:hypothetical protein